MQKGIFIVFEGPDGAGTTFHSKALAEKLRGEGHSVFHTSEPTDGPVGREIRRSVSSTFRLAPERLQLLFTADRALHLTDAVEPALQEGKVVICDRYIPSTLAYGEAAGVDGAWLRELNKKFIQPDHTFYLLPPLPTLLQRLEERPVKDAFEVAIFQTKVHHIYLRLLEESPEGISSFDTSGSKEEVMRRVFAAVQELLPQRIAHV